MNHKFCILILLLFFIINVRSTDSATTENNFPLIFGNDYQFALQYVEQQKAGLISISESYQTNPGIVAAMAFPELIRFSKFRNRLELAALEILYVNYGSRAADFSVGPWQIKPSAIEKLERYFVDSLAFESKYSYLIRFKNTDDAGIRKERLARLKNESWQLIYLAAFYHIFQKKFHKVSFADSTAKIAFYATAYNHGFDCTTDEILNWKDLALFPHGINSKLQQYRYSDIAIDFYHRYSKDQFK